MRRKNLVLWISTLAVAGVAWLLTLAAWGCELDPWGLASSVIPENVGLAATVMILRHGCEACICAALMLMATGLIEEATEERRPFRKTVDRS